MERKRKKVQSIIQNWLDNQGRFPTKDAENEYSFYANECFPIDDDRRKNATMFENAFYKKRNLNPTLKKNDAGETLLTVPEGIDAELLAKVLTNPEMTALLASFAKAMK